MKVGDKFVHKLLGVPYASKPAAFEKPLDLNITDFERETVRNADKWPPVCVQTLLFGYQLYGNFHLPHKFVMSWDCLKVPY